MSGDFDEATWRAELQQHWEQKDHFFRNHRQSPVPRDAREEFDGIPYYEPDPSYRVEATVEHTDGADTIVMDTTADTEVEYERVARLRFELSGTEQELIAYQDAEGDGESLFVPFRDETSGGDTYGAGRYMEFELDAPIEEADSVTLDFNLAYHPFCVYNDAFVCPIPPAENTLSARVEAGEHLPESGEYAFAHAGNHGHDHSH